MCAAIVSDARAVCYNTGMEVECAQLLSYIAATHHADDGRTEGRGWAVEWVRYAATKKINLTKTQ